MTQSNSTAVLTVEAFKQGDGLPRVCVVTGRPADRLYAHTALATSEASLVERARALMAGPLATMILDAQPARLDGWLPMTDAAGRRRTWLRRARLAALVGLFLAALGLAAVRSLSPTDQRALLLVLVGVPATLAFTLYASRQQLRVVLRGSTVVVPGAHPDFVRALADSD